MKHILNNIKIDFSTYVVMLISFLAGYFEYVFLTIFTILVHELGHYIIAFILGLRVREIRIFMFGGVTVLDEELTVSLFKEVITLIMGPIFQVLLLFLIYFLNKHGYVSDVTYDKFYDINIFLLSFNLLPILPLDGGKLVNNFLDFFLPYGLSHIFSIFISLVTLPFLFLFSNKFLFIFMFLFLFFKNVEEIRLHKFKASKFILERKLKFRRYRKSRVISDLKWIRREENFYIYYNGMKVFEKEYFDLCC